MRPGDFRVKLGIISHQPGGAQMLCNQCCGIEKIFNAKMAARELKSYRKKGPDGGTRLLIEALKTAHVEGLTLLDVGGGVGVIQHELFKAGISAATDVDASAAYLQAAREECERQGNLAHTTFHHGNFIDSAPELAPADIVTLDRVICCYPDMEALVELSSARARKYYAVVFPRDGWLLRLAARVGNLFLRLQRNPFRTFIHPTSAVESIVEMKGFQRHYFGVSGLIWQVIVYART
jgi:hypothetical protein